MGQLADLVPVARSRADEVLAADVPAEDFGGRDVKGLGLIALEQLAARCGAPEEEGLEDLAYEEEKAVFLVHPALSAAARSWSEGDAAALAAWWSGIEEHEGFAPEEVREYLEALREVALEAERQGVDVLYWMCV